MANRARLARYMTAEASRVILEPEESTEPEESDIHFVPIHPAPDAAKQPPQPGDPAIFNSIELESKAELARMASKLQGMIVRARDQVPVRGRGQGPGPRHGPGPGPRQGQGQGRHIYM